MLKKVIIGSGLFGFMPIVGAVTSGQEDQKSTKILIRPSDLPIYDAPPPEIVGAETNKPPKESMLQSLILPPVTIVREQLQAVWDQTEIAKTVVEDNYHEFHDRTAWLVKYFREEENKEVRYGAVVIGGLTGFIFGLRRGIIKRVLYAGVGTTVMGAICFPDETKEIAHTNGVLAKKYINIAYNFFYGVKPGDPQLEVKFPELSFPKDFSELVSQTVSLASSITKAVMPPPSKETDISKPVEDKNN